VLPAGSPRLPRNCEYFSKVEHFVGRSAVLPVATLSNNNRMGAHDAGACESEHATAQNYPRTRCGMLRSVSLALSPAPSDSARTLAVARALARDVS
jgi:hypothetical protein